jgi:hypothetical protein
MAGGLLFPDVAGTLAPLMRMRQAEEQSAFQMERARKADEADAREREAAQHVPAALSGDREALNKVAVASPGTAMKLAPLLERLDAGKAAKLKEDADFITRSGMAILNAPADQQPGLYARVRQEAEANGRNVAQWPTTYDPGWVKFNVDKAMPVAEYYKKSGEGVTFAPPAGGAPAGGDRSANAIAGIESGGRYDAVGPPANEKGQRAYGKYQIMDFNVGPWTQEVLGQAMTPQQFLASPQAQDAVFKAKFGQYTQKFGSPEAASRAWFAGEGGMNNPGAKDVLGTSVQGYGDRFAQAYGPGATGPGPQVAQGDNTRADGSGNPIQTTSGDLVPRDIMKSITPLLQPGTALGIDNRTKQYKVQDGHFIVYDVRTSMPVGLIPVPKPPKEQGAGPFAGTGMDQQAMNILLRGDPASPEYALAYSHLSKARTTINDEGRPVTIQPMDLSAVRRPTGAAAPQPQTGGGAMPPVAAPAPGVAPPPAAPGAGVTTSLPGGGSVTVGEPVAPKGPSSTEMAKLRNARAEAEKITAAANDFKSEWAKASVSDRARALAGANTPLNAAYNNFALLAKGDALFQLGVLNGPDLEIIRRTIPDPSTGKSIMTTENDVTSSVDKVLNILNTGISATEKQLNITQPQQKPAPQGATKGTYTGPDNKPISWQEIEATAKNRGMSADEVIGRLGLKPTGMQ